MSGFASLVGLVRRLLGGQGVQVVGVGDSIMSGLTAPNTTTILQALAAYCAPLASATYTNDGVPGSRLDSTVTGGASSGSDLVARYAANVYPKRPAATGSAGSILVVDIGANDFSIMTAAQATTWIAAFEAYCAQARADGFRVLAFTVMERTGNSTEIALQNKLRMNDAIRRSVNLDGYIDAAQLLTDSTNGTYFIDGTHPNDTGNRLLARALAAEVARIGQRVATAPLPAATRAPSVTPAMAAILDAAAIECATTLGQNLGAAVPAIGAGDYSISWWAHQTFAQATVSTNHNVIQKGGGSAFGKSSDANGYGQLYVLPGAGANWSPNKAHPEFWNHCAIVRVGTTATFYLNGVSIGTAVDNNVHTTLDNINFVPGKLARTRIYSRALTAAEVLAEYGNLSAFNASETAYVFALDDGCNHAGTFVEDLSSSKAHLILTDTTKVRIKRPARRGVLKKQTVGNATFPLLAGARITSYTVDVTVSGGGNVDIGDTNGGGQFHAPAVRGVGKFAAGLTSPFTASGTVFCNAAGYTINHTIAFEVL